MNSMPATHNDSKFVTHTSCDACGSSNANGVFDDGHQWCFACNTYTAPTEQSSQSNGHRSPEVSHKKNTQQKGLLKGSPKAIPARALSKDTCKKFGYLIGNQNGEEVHIAIYRDKHGKPVSQKIRTKDKRFSTVGDHRASTLFGQHLWNGGGKSKLVITEGEIDALSVSEAQQNKWPVVSLPNGAASAVRAIKDNWDYVNKFAEVILMFDMDNAGQTSALAVAELLPVGKAKVAYLPRKDASECLTQGKPSEIITAIFQAREFRPDGIKSAVDYRNVISVDETASAVSWPYSALNTMLLGMRKKELITLASGSGCGKTTFCKEVIHHLMMSGQKVGVLSLEEAPKRTLLGLVGIHLNKNLLVDRSLATDEEVLEGFDDLFNERTCVLYDSFGTNAVDLICQRIQYMAKALDVDWVILDHVSILVSGMDGDERRELDKAATAFRTLVQELDIGMIMVSHLTRPGGRGHEDGAAVSLSQLRGSHALAQLADSAIGLQKDPDDPDSDIRQVRVLKNRFSGQIGDAGTLVYSRETGRLLEEELSHLMGDETDDDEDQSGSLLHNDTIDEEEEQNAESIQ